MKKLKLLNAFFMAALSVAAVIPGCWRDGNSLPLGKDALVTAGKTYQAGDVQTLLLSDQTQGEALGLIFTTSAAGYKWGSNPATATLRINRK
ncbi:MAG: hypothetical protein FJ088_06785 [Deltaproteobacteria bacterium]|nr:hypothetical protein [Deltaproteobacteria bacterium]